MVFMNLVSINQACHQYFDPPSLWKKGILGKTTAICVAVSYVSLIIPAFMFFIQCGTDKLIGRVSPFSEIINDGFKKVKEKTTKQAQEVLKLDTIIVHKPFVDQTAINLTTKVVNTKVDKKDFKKHIFKYENAVGRHQLLPSIKALLEETVEKTMTEAHDINCHNVNPFSNQDWLDKPFDPAKKIKMSFDEKFFDYSKKNHFYYDFAHATSFGGASLNYGCVQEELQFKVFPDLEKLAFVTNNGIHPCAPVTIDDGTTHHYPPIAKPSPFIIEGISSEFDLTDVPYGGALRRANPEAVKKAVKRVKEPVPVNIIGIAAKDWREEKKREYSFDDLVYHCEATFLAGLGAKKLAEQNKLKETVIHTAPWGCGAFENSEDMITAIQYLSARMSGVDLVWHGVEHHVNPTFTKEKITRICNGISELIDMGKTPREILNVLVIKSSKDKAWQPK
jgi:hypothetical protein